MSDRSVMEGRVTKMVDGVAWGEFSQGSYYSSFDIPVEPGIHGVGDTVHWTRHAQETNNCDEFVMVIGADFASLYWLDLDDDGQIQITRVETIDKSGSVLGGQTIH